MPKICGKMVNGQYFNTTYVQLKVLVHYKPHLHSTYQSVEFYFLYHAHARMSATAEMWGSVFSPQHFFVCTGEARD